MVGSGVVEALQEVLMEIVGSAFFKETYQIKNNILIL